MFQIDANLASIVIAAITVFGTILTKRMDTNQNSVDKAVSKQAVFVKQINELNIQIAKKNSECHGIVEQVMFLTLTSNIDTMKHVAGIEDTENIIEMAEDLKTKYAKLKEEIKALQEKQKLLTDISDSDK